MFADASYRLVLQVHPGVELRFDNGRITAMIF